MSDPTASHRFTNRLANESSPYLLQHAHNPVDWHPWGEEAFELARKQNKPIFLSVGYSTCYWCHVMERQCFEDEAIAAEMNRRFINIKVDREERPDVDQLYMITVQILTRHGGWPMSVFLTPDLRPFYGGTYFPPADMYGRPGFVSILRGIDDAFHNRSADVEKTADQILNLLRENARPPQIEGTVAISEPLLDEMIQRSISDYDQRFGGFGGAPKFPRETLLELLLVYLRNPAAKLHEQVATQIRHALDAMAAGGIRDQLGGGFHRYSTDDHWLIPHFEIMLYDNAMLAWCYVEAFVRFNEPRYAEIARGIFDFVLREMTSPTGGFFTALDAEVDGQEGLNYLWTLEEIETILGADDAALFKHVYGVDQGPNFADPHQGSGTPDKYILFLPRPLEESAADSKRTPQALKEKLAPMRQALYQARMKRKQPLLDTKIITSWNALMIRALAFGGKALNEPRYIDAAKKAGLYLFEHHATSAGGLYRTSRDGKAKYPGFLDDYAFLAQAFLAIADATGSSEWSDRAVTIVRVMSEKFEDRKAGGFFFTEENARDLIVRQKTGSDSPLPSGNGVAALVLLETRDFDPALRVIAEFAAQIESHGEGMSALLQAALQLCRTLGKIEISRDRHEWSSTSQSGDITAQAREIVSAHTEWRSDKELAVHLSIRKGYHINAAQISNELSLIATKLSVIGDSSAMIEYPTPRSYQPVYAERALQVYDGEFTVLAKFSDARRGQPFKLAFTYQACDDSACLIPVTVQLEAPLS